ncbi:hypothetical protein [Kitasatospora sp. NPDC051705]|uniref:hypothetical protein n=1 Tax=Kitasatospora sp. NPDC051705 TaxID=3364057 RepID=UPI003798CEBE
MVDQEQYERYREDSTVLAAVGEHVHLQVGPVTVRLPGDLARAAVDAWERDEESSDGLGEESREQYELRDQAGTLALIGLAISESGRWDDDEVTVDLHVHSAGAAWLTYADSAGTSFRVLE